MTFWSDRTLTANLDKVIFPPDKDKVDASGYRLSVGNQIYITRDLEKKDKVIIDLLSDKIAEIPAGQFALILTEEKVTIPKNVIGFISVRAQTKFKGLINVSGFHVDPGYSDHLIFAVFNAGPKAISIKKGDDIFIIWFAYLDKKNKKLKGGCGFDKGIPSKFVDSLNGQVDSPTALSERVNRIGGSVARFQKQFWPVVSFLAPLIIGGAWWGFQRINELSVNSRVHQERMEDHKFDLAQELDRIREDYKSLKSKLDNQKILIDVLSEKLSRRDQVLPDEQKN
jgi:dCTP deaminase